MTRAISLTQLDDAFRAVPAGAKVVVGNACGTPLTLLRGLAARAEEAGPITLSAGLMLGDPPLEAALRSGALRLRSWHVHGALRRLWRDGVVDYLPVRLSDLFETVLEEADVALIRVGPPDADGWCSLGPSTSFALAAAELAGTVIAEVADDVPRTRGASRIHVSAIDHLVASDTPMAAYRSSEPDPVSLQVARNVIEILPDGATLQLGIGSVTESLATELATMVGEKSLNLLGMVTASMVPFVEAVAAADRGPVRAIEIMGDAALMSWADDNPAIEMSSSQQLHNPLELARTPKFVSVNSAVAVDRFGQVIAESVNGAVLAGVGGSADFADGAHLSTGGLRIIALKSTAREGASTIVAAHHAADTVTTAYHGVDVVVTEHGAAWLLGRTRSERKAALVAIAAPDHRDALAKEKTI